MCTHHTVSFYSLTTFGTRLIVVNVCDRKHIALLNTSFVVGILVYVVYRSEPSSQLLVPAECEGCQIR